MITVTYKWADKPATRRALRSVLLGATIFVSLAALTQAQAQTRTADETVVVTGNFLNSETTTATKTDTPILVTPQSVSVITADQLTLQNPQDIGQAISYSAGVSTQQFGYDPRFPQFQIRGFNEFYGGVFQDGLRLSASDFIAPLTEAYGLDQLQIVRGPTSVLYGQNNPGGMVNLTTKKPKDETFGEVELQAGSYDRFDGRFDVNAPLTDDGTVLARLTGLYRAAGTQYPNVPDDEYYLAPAVTWTPRDGTSITLLANVQRVSGGESDEYFAKYLLPPGYPQSVYQGDPNFGHSTQRTFAVGYMLDQRLSDAWSLHQSFRYNDSEDDLIQAAPITFDTATTLLMQAEHLHETLDTIAVDTNVTGKLQTGPVAHTLIFGVDYLNTPFSSQEWSDPAPDADYFNPVYTLALPTPATLISSTHQGSDQVGFYAQDQMQYGDHWFFTGGLREDLTSQSTASLAAAPDKQDDNALTGRAGLVYKFDFGLAPYVSYSTSFVPQQGTDFSGNAFDPLTGKQMEAGLRYAPDGGWLSLTASVYDITEQNVLSADPDPTHIGFQVQTGEERSRGFEFEGVVTPIPGVTITAAYTYGDVRIIKTTDPTALNHQPGNTPATQISVFGDYTLQDGMLRGLGAGLGLRYTGPSWDGTDNVSFQNPEQTYVDAEVHYAFDHWRFGVNATNLGDSNYPLCFGGVCHFSRDRTIIGSITRTF